MDTQVQPSAQSPPAAAPPTQVKPEPSPTAHKISALPGPPPDLQPCRPPPSLLAHPLLQPHWPCRPLGMPKPVLPQGLCTSHPRCLKNSSPKTHPTPTGILLQGCLLGETSWNHTQKRNTSIWPAPAPALASGFIALPCPRYLPAHLPSVSAPPAQRCHTWRSGDSTSLPWQGHSACSRAAMQWTPEKCLSSA